VEAVYRSLVGHGYHGPAVAVFCAGDDRRAQGLVPDIRVSERYGVIGVADGHHRLGALKLLDERRLLRSPLIVVQLIPAHDTRVVRINHPDPSQTPVDIAEVETCFETQANVITPCDSYFEARLQDGSWVKISDAQPDIVIASQELLRRRRNGLIGRAHRWDGVISRAGEAFRRGARGV
jgi:hypothetical protein